MATKSIGTLKASLILDTRGWMLGFQKAGAVTKEATRSLAGFVGGALKNVGASMVTTAAAAVASAAGIHAFAQSFANVDRQAKLADRLGIEMESMQRLSAVSRITGTDVELLAKAMLTMGKTVGAGGKPLDRRFIEVATAISAIKNPIERANRAAVVFGKQGATVLDAFAGNGASIKQAAATIDRFGLALSRTDASKIEAANDAMANLGVAISMVVNKLALEMAPTVERVANSAIDGMENFGRALDRVNIKWSTFSDYAELWGDLISNPFSLSTATANFVTRDPGLSKPGGQNGAGSGRVPDLLKSGRSMRTSALELDSVKAARASQSDRLSPRTLRPGAFELNSMEAVRAVQNAAGGDGTSAIVAELKKAVQKLTVIADDARRDSADKDGFIFREGRI